MVNSCLVQTTGWIGDILFSLSLAEKLKKEQNFDRLDYLLDKPQPFHLVKFNPHIDNVYLGKTDDSCKYDQHYILPIIESKDIAPTIQYQKACNIKNLSPEFKVTIPEQYLTTTRAELLEKAQGKKIVSIQGDWNLRFWDITQEESDQQKFDQTGVYPFYKTLRPGNINLVLQTVFSEFKDKYLFITIDPWDRRYQDIFTDPRGYDADPSSYTRNAIIIACSDIFIGAEGGLTNLSAGLGIKTVYTTCHMTRMFGPNGVMSQSKDIQLGPAKLFPNANHVAISPYATVNQVIEDIRNQLK